MITFEEESPNIPKTVDRDKQSRIVHKNILINMKLQKFNLLQIFLTITTKPGEFIHKILLGYHKATIVLPTCYILNFGS